MLVMTNMYHLLIFVTFNKLGLDNEWSEFHHTSSFWYISVNHDLCPPISVFLCLAVALCV